MAPGRWDAGSQYLEGRRGGNTLRRKKHPDRRDLLPCSQCGRPRFAAIFYLGGAAKPVCGNCAQELDRE